jgi:hypothetical protein
MCAAIPFIVLATFSALMGTSSTPAALAREATQDSYCLQGRQWGYPATASFRATSSAWRLPAACLLRDQPDASLRAQRRGRDRNRY